MEFLGIKKIFLNVLHPETYLDNYQVWSKQMRDIQG